MSLKPLGVTDPISIDELRRMEHAAPAAPAGQVVNPDQVKVRPNQTLRKIAREQLGPNAKNSAVLKLVDAYLRANPQVAARKNQILLSGELLTKPKDGPWNANGAARPSGPQGTKADADRQVEANNKVKEAEFAAAQSTLHRFAESLRTIDPLTPGQRDAIASKLKEIKGTALEKTPEAYLLESKLRHTPVSAAPEPAAPAPAPPAPAPAPPAPAPAPPAPASPAAAAAAVPEVKLTGAEQAAAAHLAKMAGDLKKLDGDVGDDNRMVAGAALAEVASKFPKLLGLDEVQTLKAAKPIMPAEAQALLREELKTNAAQLKDVTPTDAQRKELGKLLTRVARFAPSLIDSADAQALFKKDPLVPKGSPLATK